MKIKLILFLLPIIDSLTLWCYGWRRVDVGVGMGRAHYEDPVTGDFWLKDIAIKICTERARADA